MQQYNQTNSLSSSVDILIKHNVLTAQTYLNKLVNKWNFWKLPFGWPSKEMQVWSESEFHSNGRL